MNNLPVNTIDKTIARILSGEAQIDDVLQFSAWLNEKEEHLQEFLLLKSYWDAGADSESASYPEASYKNCMEKISVNPPSSPKVTRKRIYLWAVAASIILLLGLSSIFRIYRNQVPVEYYTYYNSGDIHEFALADGTHVTLNRNSKLTYSSKYGKEGRNVTLEGEAYFDVKKNPDQVFKIDLGNHTSVEVLGTKFNMQAYPDKPEIITTLEEGSIRFHSEKQDVDIIPGQQLVYVKETGATDIRKVEPELFLAWKDRLYRYHSITMRDLGKDLEEVYNIKIIIPERLQNVKVSGSFIYGQNIEEILDIMQKSIAFKWKKQNDSIIIQ